MGWLFTDNGSWFFNLKAFSLHHFAVILFFAALFLALFFIFRKKSDTVKWRFLWVLILICVGYKVFNFFFWGFVNPDNLSFLTGKNGDRNIARWIATVIPISLCSLNAILYPIAMKSKNKIWLQYMVTIASVGAVFAFFLLSGLPQRPWHFVEFLFTHWTYIVIPIYLVAFKLFKPRAHYAAKTLGLILLMLIAGALIGLVMNLTLNPQFNPSYLTDNKDIGWRTAAGEYLFNIIWTLSPDGTPLLLQLFQILPVPLLYMILLFPVLVVLWSAIILPMHTKAEIKALPADFKNGCKNFYYKAKSVFKLPVRRSDAEPSINDTVPPPPAKRNRR
ncbi:MAG: YwaF family protein [Clostridiales bacterium]|jgi:hypothetical protein|nr:YwaF family protein [Clostridiales bacterium]